MPRCVAIVLGCSRTQYVIVLLVPTKRKHATAIRKNDLIMFVFSVLFKFNCTDGANRLPNVTFIKVKHRADGLFIPLSILIENKSITDTFI